MQKVKSLPIKDVLLALDQLAPQSTAEDWDNVGLLVGDPKKDTTGAVLSIDLTFEAVELAKSKGYRLIVNHHPCIFPKGRGLSKVLAGTPIFEAIQNGISVIACHTNFDRCSLEVVQKVSAGLGVQPKGRLIDHPAEAFIKLVTFVPKDSLERVRDAICSAGAGQIGNYDLCTFGTEGEGTFRGGEETRPFIGNPGQFERAREIRLETVLPKGMEGSVLKALLKSHPYEEVAYEFYPVRREGQSLGLVRGLGYGFWGEFPSPRPFSDVMKDVKRLFGINGFWITDPAPSSVTRVGFVAGKGASFVDPAASLHCDLFITGEVGYHAALSGSRRGVTVLEMGHRESEKFFVETMKDWLSALGLGIAEIQSPTQKIWQEV